MPKQTFFNLPEDKRSKIIDYALDEFAKYDYKSASLSRIVEKAGIAKGSMYQYFDNKKDLYLYMIDYVSKAKLEFISSVLAPDTDDFFVVYKHMILVASQYDLKHIRHSQLLYNVGREASNEELGDIAAAMLKTSQQYVKSYLVHAQSKNQIRSDLDIDLMAFIVNHLSIYMSEYIKDKFGFSYGNIITEGKGSLPITITQLESVLDELISFFKTGLGPQLNKL